MPAAAGISPAYPMGDVRTLPNQMTDPGARSTTSTSTTTSSSSHGFHRLCEQPLRRCA